MKFTNYWHCFRKYLQKKKKKKKIAEDGFKCHCYFSQKIGFDILCKLSPEQTVCMKCQSLFSHLSSAEFAQRKVKVNLSCFLWGI